MTDFAVFCSLQRGISPTKLTLKRDIILVVIVKVDTSRRTSLRGARRWLLLLRRATWLRAPSPAALVGRLRIAVLATTLTLTAHKLHVFAYDAQSTSFLPCLLVVPSIELQAPFDKQGTPLGKILAGELRLTPP